MATITERKGLVGVVLVVVLVLANQTMGSIDRVELIMPKYAMRGGQVVLKCEHSVPPEQLYKVEWQKAGTKIFQYIKGRRPPFRYFHIQGAELNKTNCNDKQVQLSMLDFDASGSYSCVVSMDTPIFSKDSEDKVLTIIEPQNNDPIVTFDKSSYEVGDTLKANCSTAPARPPPHITWLINGRKVDDSLTRSFSNGRIYMFGYFEQKLPSVKELSIRVDELHVGEDGQLWITCLSTIPGYVNHNEKYADERNHSTKVEILMQELPPEEIISTNENLVAKGAVFQPLGGNFLLLAAFLIIVSSVQ